MFSPKRLLNFIVLISMFSLHPATARVKHHHKHITNPNANLNKIVKLTNRLPYLKEIEYFHQRSNILCMAMTIYNEARGISRTEKILVGQTVIHRVESEDKTVCKIISEKGQFPWVKSISRKWLPKEMDSWVEAQKLAVILMFVKSYPQPDCYIKFFSVGLFPSHRRNLECMLHYAGHYYYNLRTR